MDICQLLFVHVCCSLLSCVFWVLFFVLYYLCCVLRFFLVIYIFGVLFFHIVFFYFIFLPCCIKRTSLFWTASSIIRLEKNWPTILRIFSLWVGQIWLIHYLVICLCSFWSYIIVIKQKYPLIFLLFLLILSLHKWYCPIRFLFVYHFHRLYIIKFIST